MKKKKIVGFRKLEILYLKNKKEKLVLGIEKIIKIIISALICHLKLI